MQMNEHHIYEAAFQKVRSRMSQSRVARSYADFQFYKLVRRVQVEAAGQVVNFLDYAAAFDAAVACIYTRRSRYECPAIMMVTARSSLIL